MVASNDPNQIGRAGEIVARKILEKLYPPPNYVVQDLNDFEECRFSKETESLSEDKMEDLITSFYVPDFIIESHLGEKIGVEVKTTKHEKIKIRGGAKKGLKYQLEKSKESQEFNKLLILKICLGTLPYVKYSVKEIE
jgi:hypothetical protein